MTGVFMKSNTRLKLVRVKIKKLHSPATKHQITILDSNSLVLPKNTVKMR